MRKAQRQKAQTWKSKSGKTHMEGGKRPNSPKKGIQTAGSFSAGKRINGARMS